MERTERTDRTDRPDRRRRDGRQGDRPRDDKQEELDQRIVDVTVVGNNNGKVGIGIGKARGVQDAIRKATDRARNNMKDVNIVSGTIPHEILSKHGGAKVLLKPASPGTGIKAGGGVRAVLEAVGIHDILTKSLGSSSKMNATYATFNGLMELKNVEDESKRRNKTVADVQPFWRRGNGSSTNSE